MQEPTHLSSRDRRLWRDEAEKVLQAHEVRKSLSAFLCTVFDSQSSFFTVSMRKPVHPHQAIGYMASIQRTLAGKRGFVAAELHKGGTIHFHGIHSDWEDVVDGHTLGDLSTLDVYDDDWRDFHIQRLTEYKKARATYHWDKLFKQFGRSDYHQVRELSGVSDYCAKYVTKELHDWALW